MAGVWHNLPTSSNIRWKGQSNEVFCLGNLDQTGLKSCVEAGLKSQLVSSYSGLP